MEGRLLTRRRRLKFGASVSAKKDKWSFNLRIRVVTDGVSLLQLNHQPPTGTTSTMSTTANPPTPQIPILLLKTPSPAPASDAYTHHLSPSFAPTFVPVLSHTLLPDPLITLLLTHFSPSPPSRPRDHPQPFPYGGMIFTSQRAVAALGTALNAPQVVRIQEEVAEGLGGRSGVRLYVVGPATERALRAVVRDAGWAGCGIYGGEEAGSGEVLARIMLGGEGGEGAYEVREGAGGRKKAVLFLVGEKRRDIIPRMLMDPELPVEERVQVDEMELYRTGELEEFEFHFTQTLARINTGTVGWIVVFSPTAGEGMLRGLGWLDKTSGRVKHCVGDPGRRTFVACIGPTTKDYLAQEFGFEPDVVARKPSPQGIKEGIENFMNERAL